MPDTLLQAVKENRDAIKQLVTFLQRPQSFELQKPRNSISSRSVLRYEYANTINDIFNNSVLMSNIENPLPIEEMSSASAHPPLPSDLALREQEEVLRLQHDRAAAVAKGRRRQREEFYKSTPVDDHVVGGGKRKSKRRIPRKRRRPTKRR